MFCAPIQFRPAILLQRRASDGTASAKGPCSHSIEFDLPTVLADPSNGDSRLPFSYPTRNEKTQASTLLSLLGPAVAPLGGRAHLRR